MGFIKKISMGSSLLSAKVTKRYFPFMVNWAITGRCNLRCTHCYGKYGEIQQAELSLTTIKKTIDKLYSIGTRRITLEGGEPLVRKDIIEIIDYINSKGMEISLCTNGVLLNKYIKQLKGKVDLIVLSLDGNEEHHNQVRGKDNFQKVLQALRLANNHNIRTLIFSCLLENNLTDVDELVQIAVDNKSFITFNIAVAQLSSEQSRESLQKTSDQAYKKVIKQIVEYKKKGYPVYYSMDNYNQVLNWPDFNIEKVYERHLAQNESGFFNNPHLIKCVAGKLFCYIECNGDVYPCYQTVGTLPVKNIEKDGVDSAFNYLQKINYCKHCYNLTLSELNLQANLNLKSVLKVIQNYFIK